MTRTEACLTKALELIKERGLTDDGIKLIRELYGLIPFWPDDGGLKDPVKRLDETFNGFDMLRKRFGSKKIDN